jgi:hypothetical protein
MTKIFSGVSVSTLNEQIEAHPELWNQYTMRTKMYESSPHREVDDIWLRYNDHENFDTLNPEAFHNEHYSVWYDAITKLTDAKRLIENAMVLFDGEKLGGVLITRIPPGGRVYPHNDAMGWHSNFYRGKYLLLLQSAPGQSFNFDDESHEGEAGDLFIFDNHQDHWVVNDSDTDRVSLIFAVRQRGADDE